MYGHNTGISSSTLRAGSIDNQLHHVRERFSTVALSASRQKAGTMARIEAMGQGQMIKLPANPIALRLTLEFRRNFEPASPWFQ